MSIIGDDDLVEEDVDAYLLLMLLLRGMFDRQRKY